MSPNPQIQIQIQIDGAGMSGRSLTLSLCQVNNQASKRWEVFKPESLAQNFYLPVNTTNTINITTIKPESPAEHLRHPVDGAEQPHHD